ncbi:MAG: hypothetical protein JO246_03050 [Frankiaceae bacterium]|nr:hypothetical protein [Frankiaceae bacterium]MBV9871945.1 hypothetical protein [Frankiaceae bacterium]
MAEMLRSLVEAVVPDVGLRTARRNAWAAMAADAKRARARVEAAAAVSAAVAHPTPAVVTA